MSTTEQVERELKFDVPPSWALPDTATLAPDGQVRVETVELASTYFDTAGNDLLRSGVTLRRRTGDTDTGWHLKVPAGDARTELHAPLGDEHVPPEDLSRLLRGITSGAELRPIATLTTTRTVHHLADAQGRPVAQIADDDVIATGPRVDVGTRWREVEVELDGGDEQFLSESAQWLSRSGASPATSKSKVARAVGLSGEVSAPPEGTLAALVHDYLQQQLLQMVRGDIALRREQDAIHATRVATRRYRSVLRIFADLFDESAPALDEELKWYAGVLGAVRDVQVLRKHLLANVHALPPEVVLGPVASSLWQILDRDERSGRDTLAATLDSDRYAALLRTVRDYTEQGPAGADQPATEVRRYVRRADRLVIKRLQAAAAAEPARDELMHRARKAAKRARYAAEVAEPVLGKAARRLVARDKRLQDELGELQDAVVAGQFLRRAGAEIGVRPGENGFTIGVLWQLEQERAQRERERARKEVRKLAPKR